MRERDKLIKVGERESKIEKDERNGQANKRKVREREGKIDKVRR